MRPEELAVAFGIPDLPMRLAAVDARIKESLVADDSPLGPASFRVAEAGGKRLRPLLAVVCAELGGVFDDRVVSAAAAVELVQVGSLVHDDIFDEADTRRGTPTINAVEGVNHALVAGDYILARAGAEAAHVSKEMAALLAATITQLCAGQMREMVELFDVDRTVAAHLASIGGKTAALFECACRAGALCAGLPVDVTSALGGYGRGFGMAFQILDDVLDVIGDPDRLGKPVGTDLDGGVYTLPVLLALQGREGPLLARLLRTGTAGDRKAALDMVRSSDGVAAALGTVDRFNDEAAAAVTPVAEERLGAALRTFPHAYKGWALEEFRAG